MLRSDYDGHPLWETLRGIDTSINTILEDHFPDDLPSIERIWVQEEYVRSFDAVASTRVAFFHSQMLDAVNTVWQQVASSLDQRIASGTGGTNFVVQAADQSETGLLQMAAWPRAYGRGGEVKQMNTLFEELLEAQRTSIEALKSAHADLRSEVTAIADTIETKRDEAATALDAAKSEAAQLASQIEAQSSTVTTAVEESQAAVRDLSRVNSKAYDEWVKEREAAFTEDFAGLRKAITDQLAASGKEYDELLAAKAKYTKLVSAIAADEVAAEFRKEARWGRVAGIALYALGFLLLAGAAVPLILLIVENAKDDSGGINWTPIVIRLAVGVLAGSAATVAIRLGGRLINSANGAKRMELELRAIGPFLANVEKADKVDDARIELVNKAFGKTYSDANSAARDKKEETIPVTTASQLIDLVERISKLNPPSN